MDHVANNTEASRLLLDSFNRMMLHNAAEPLQFGLNGVTVQAHWQGLGDTPPILRVAVIGVSPCNWQGSQPGHLPNTNAAPPKEVYTGAVCPDCGQLMRGEGGCMVCKHCGYSKCG